MGEINNSEKNDELISNNLSAGDSANSESENTRNNISPKSITVKPSFIDFGYLKPLISPKATLNLEGGPVTILSSNERIKVVPLEILEETGIIEVNVVGGEEGDLIWDSIEIRGSGVSVMVPVICNWDEGLANVKSDTLREPGEAAEIPSPVKQGSRVIVDETDKPGLGSVPEVSTSPISVSQSRDFIAPVCPICRRNLVYDSNTKSWLRCEKCKSNVVGSLAGLAAEEGSKGIEDLKKTAKDFWEVITGKKPWDIR